MNVLIMDESVSSRDGLKIILNIMKPHYTIFTCEPQTKVNKDYSSIDLIIVDPMHSKINDTVLILSLMEQQAAPNIMIMTSLHSNENWREWMTYPNVSILLKQNDLSLFKTAVQSIARANRYIDPVITKKMEEVSLLPQPVLRPIDLLTAREWEVLELLVLGMDTKDIAKKLFIQASTVSYNLGNIIRKLKVKTKAGAAAKATEKGWIAKDKLERVYGS
jgi:DNA-binding NarL/FixJ family response regulator